VPVASLPPLAPNHREMEASQACPENPSARRRKKMSEVGRTKRRRPV